MLKPAIPLQTQDSWHLHQLSAPDDYYHLMRLEKAEQRASRGGNGPTGMGCVLISVPTAQLGVHWWNKTNWLWLMVFTLHIYFTAWKRKRDTVKTQKVQMWGLLKHVAMLNADSLAFNDPQTGLKSMSTPRSTVLDPGREGQLPPKRSWDSKKIFGQIWAQSPFSFISLKNSGFCNHGWATVKIRLRHSLSPRSSSGLYLWGCSSTELVKNTDAGWW